jgi:hypothetical protein
MTIRCALLCLTRLDARAFNQLCHPWQVGGEQSRVRLGLIASSVMGRLLS